MALIKCSECGQEISDMATACPKCGYPMQKGISDEIKELEKIVKEEKFIGWTNIICAVVVFISDAALVVSYLYGSGQIDGMINGVAQAELTSVQKFIVEMVPLFKMLIKCVLWIGILISVIFIVNGGLRLRSAKRINSIIERMKTFNNKM